MFMNPGAVDAAIFQAGEPLDIFARAHESTTKCSTYAEISLVNNTSFSLIKAGLRPNVDAIANIPSSCQAVEEGNAVKWRGSWYQIGRVEESRDSLGVVLNRRLQLVLLSPGGLDMTQ